MSEKPDYKDTVFLPKTDFPMKAGLAAKEPAILARWIGALTAAAAVAACTACATVADVDRYMLAPERAPAGPQAVAVDGAPARAVLVG